MTVSDKPVVVVTGVGTNAGGMIAQSLATHESAASRAFVVSCSSQEHLDPAYDAIIAGGGVVLPVIGSLDEPAQVERLVALTVQEYGRIDAFVDARAGLRDDSPVGQVPFDLWERRVGLRLNSLYKVFLELRPVFARQGHGKLVSVLYRSEGATLNTIEPAQRALIGFIGEDLRSIGATANLLSVVFPSAAESLGTPGRPFADIVSWLIGDDAAAVNGSHLIGY